MFDILSAIFYDEALNLRQKTPFLEPCTPAETQVLAQLHTLETPVAEAVEHAVYALVQEERYKSFLSGTRFGAQLALQLSEGF